MRILIVDEQPLFGKALSDIVLAKCPNTNVHHAVNAGEMLLALNQGQEFDLVFLDLVLPDTTGLLALKTLRRHRQNLPVVIISGDASLTVIESAYAFSILGFVSKKVPYKAMNAAVGKYLDIADATPVIGATGQANNFDPVTDHSELASVYGLTPREYEVARAIGDGLVTRDIAERLGITDGTVKQHTNRVFRKMSVNNRSEALAIIAKLRSSSA